MPRPKTTDGRADIMGRTGVTNAQLNYWSRVYLNKFHGTGNHRIFTDEEVALISEAVNACRVWGPSAAKAVFQHGARLATTEPK